LLVVAKGTTYEQTQAAWLRLREQANHGPVQSNVPTVETFLLYWLDDIIRPNLAPKTCEKYELFSRLHIIPHLGTKRLDRLQVRDIRHWLNKLTRICQCCAQGKDAARPENKRRCCALGKCCRETLSASSRKDARNVLRAALTCAVEDQLITQNPAAVIRLTNRREPRRKRQSWTVDEARRFLENARNHDDVFYPAYVLILVLGLRKGELLGLTWERVNLDSAELHVGEQLQRVGRQLLRREVKTETSEAPLPLPDLCIAALKLRRHQQDADEDRAGRNWLGTGLVFTTRFGTPIEPRNFNRSFDRRIVRANVPEITVHGARKTCGSLLAALDVHPRVAMQILRHSKIAVTMEIYTEVPSAATRSALRKLGQWLGALRPRRSLLHPALQSSAISATVGVSRGISHIDASDDDPYHYDHHVRVTTWTTAGIGALQDNRGGGERHHHRTESYDNRHPGRTRLVYQRSAALRQPSVHALVDLRANPIDQTLRDRTIVVATKFAVRCRCGGDVVPGGLIHYITIHLDYCPGLLA
jgi:integrase